MSQPEHAQSILDASRVVNISTAVVVQHNNQFLLIAEKKRNIAGLWNFPSGKAHVNESIFDAARREALEETGYHVKLTGLVSVYYYRTKERVRRPKQKQASGSSTRRDRITVRFNFWGELEDPHAQPSRSDVGAVAWKTAEEIEQLLSEHTLRNWVAEKLAQQALRGQRFPLELVHVARR